MSKQPTRIQQRILAIIHLAGGESRSFTIRKMYGEQHWWGIGYVRLYSHLEAMDDAGWLSCVQPSIADEWRGDARKWYRLTNLGRFELGLDFERKDNHETHED